MAIKRLKKNAKHNIVLLSLNFTYIFVIGLFSDMLDLHFVYYTFISLIFFFSILTVSDAYDRYFYVPTLMIALTWIAEFMDMPVLSQITGIISTLFFLVIIFLLILKISRSKTVGLLEFIEAINIYLLLGIAASVLFGAIYAFNHDAYNPPGEILKNQSDFIYYAFVTMSTLGYGDITPNDSLARSLSIFFSVAGQLYLAMIIAMLVGKYLSNSQEEN